MEALLLGKLSSSLSLCLSFYSAGLEYCERKVQKWMQSTPSAILYKFVTHNNNNNNNKP